MSTTTTENKRLQQAVREVVEKIAREQGQRLGATMGPMFIDSLTEIVYKQMESFALDTENFASHARRAVINSDDVLLCARRNDDLHDILDNSRKNLPNNRRLQF